VAVGTHYAISYTWRTYVISTLIISKRALLNTHPFVRQSEELAFGYAQVAEQEEISSTGDAVSIGRSIASLALAATQFGTDYEIFDAPVLLGGISLSN